MTSTRPDGLSLPPTAWVKLNRLRSGIERFHSSMHKWGLALSPNCTCGAPEQTEDQVLTVGPYVGQPWSTRSDKFKW